MSSNDHRVVLIDASIYIFKSYFSLPDNWFSKEDYPTNAVYGYTLFLLKLLESQRPKYIAAAYDEKPGNGVFDIDYLQITKPIGYCQTRRWPFNWKPANELVSCWGVSGFASDEFEADDLIGSLASISRQQGYNVDIISRDKDLAQLLASGDRMWDFGAG